jgi:hypothetical protein
MIGFVGCAICNLDFFNVKKKKPLGKASIFEKIKIK